MNCANHPDVAVAAYCQSCGKPLCTACIRSVGGVIYCEPCLAARLSPGSSSGSFGGNLFTDPNNLHAHPMLAGLLGFIPGVGAMYNGQFVKALAHVLIFAVFISLSDRSFIFALLLAAWVFYQVFDAAQTAKARRDGLPLPNPFGLNDLGSRLGVTPATPAAPFTGFTANPAPGNPAGPVAAADPAGGFNPGPNPGGAGPFPPPPAYTTSYAAAPPPAGNPNPGSPVYPYPAAPEPQRHPLGAIVLIGIGLLLLLHTLGVFEEEWISRAWPVLIIGIGAWLLYRRSRDVPRGGAS
jgi:TM2 domain-containing membrane protein YozV